MGRWDVLRLCGCEKEKGLALILPYSYWLLLNEIEICLSFQPCQGLYVGTRGLYFTLEPTSTLT